MNTSLLPIYIQNQNYPILIVGGGNSACQKVMNLLEYNEYTSIHIVSPTLSDELFDLVEKHPHLTWEEKVFEPQDLEEVSLVVIAVKNLDLNESIKSIAKEKRILIHSIHFQELSDFFFDVSIKEKTINHSFSTVQTSKIWETELEKEHIQPNLFKEKITHHQFKIKNDGGTKYRKLAFQLSLLFLATFLGYGFSTIISFDEFKGMLTQMPKEFYGMLLVGFFAQLVDGAVGLGYGVTCATSMMLLGIKSTAISGSIHTAEMFSSGITGYSHYKFGNVNKRLLIWLAGFGVLGAVCGALLLSYLGNQFENITYSILAVYSMILGARLIIIAFQKKIIKKRVKNIGLLGFLGGFLDAFSGGGWGPIVTSTLLSRGRKSKFVVGTVSLSEFFVTLSASIVFFSVLGVSHWYIVLGLIVGGAIAAPLAARLAGKLPQKVALLLVATLVIVFSVRMLMKVL
ncbi:MAG: TSUP family transporter [Raineya sp.]|jgi:hypothetical protein|nr:TSUP family transporter [Raineya sp.]